MKLLKILSLIITLLTISNCKNDSNSGESTKLQIAFKEDSSKFTMPQKQLIREVIFNSEKEVRTLLPELPDSIKVVVEVVDWDIESVGGVTGRTASNIPPLVEIQVSYRFPGGIANAVKTALKDVVFHEFHHLYRGWAIQDNKFEQGIAIAAVNEGLAVVFSEVYTNLILEANSPPKDSIADSWVKEIMELPKDADYQKWMFQHPDGRTSIGYRSGNYLVRKALSNSGIDILELSELTPNEILSLSGYLD
ncbi:DUF2268 domain-containing protein [Muriicola sp. Z0-33]|uniref:DUF2268 domain-containing protein n=1 Tax=Muriicola sp. Z0-33 TaxID=2816957 RepID=UPI002238AF63|nr:DUF2268 domain-containing protein [Muriicola sp. Z0-33]MCW5515284.1 hypothetical protein [Muriicola sp. Z0-33]